MNKNNEQNEIINKIIGIIDQEQDQIIENRNNLTILKFNNQSYSEDIGEDMKGITKRKDGLYMVRKTINGTTYTKYAKTINDAKKIRTKFKHLNDKNYNKSYIFKNWANEWMQTYKQPFVKPDTFKQIVNAIDRVNLTFGTKNLNEISTASLQLFMNKIKKNRTKEKTQLYLNACLQKAENLGYIKLNPFKGVIRDKKLKQRSNSFSFNQQELILNNIKNTIIEKEIYIYLLTGCRPNELPKSENFDFENNLITVTGTKTDNAAKRIIEMSDKFAKYIKPYITSNKRPTVTQISNMFKNICQKLKIDKPTLYRLRHTFATNHYSLGTPAKTVQYWMGHSTIKLTLDIYTDIDKTATKEKIRNLYDNFYFEQK